jgi:hypothetical protein
VHHTKVKETNHVRARHSSEDLENTGSPPCKLFRTGQGEIMKSESKNRCWPGYEPVPGKEKNEAGSCRKKAESKTTPTEKAFQQKRKAQLDRWEREHPGSPRKAAQHLRAPRKRKAVKKRF